MATKIATTGNNHLPLGTADQILKGALGLQGQSALVGVNATTVTEATANQGTGYDRRVRSQLIALQTALLSDDPDIQAKAQVVARWLGVDPAAIGDLLDRQQAAWDGFQDAWTVTLGARGGRQVVDGTRRLARSMVEADVARAEETLDAAGTQALEDDLRDYRSAVADDTAGRVAQAALTRDLVAAGNQQIGSFAGRRQLVDTLDRLANQEQVPWEVMVQAGATLDQLTAENTPDPVTAGPVTIGAPGTATGTTATGGSKVLKGRRTQRG